MVQTAGMTKYAVCTLFMAIVSSMVMDTMVTYPNFAMPKRNKLRDADDLDLKDDYLDSEHPPYEQSSESMVRGFFVGMIIIMAITCIILGVISYVTFDPIYMISRRI